VPRASWTALGRSALKAEWIFPGGQRLQLVANLGSTPVPRSGSRPDWGRLLYTLGMAAPGWDVLPPWSVAWYLAEPV
jgi:hypothetical protein